MIEAALQRMVAAYAELCGWIVTSEFDMSPLGRVDLLLEKPDRWMAIEIKIDLRSPAVYRDALVQAARYRRWCDAHRSEPGRVYLACPLGTTPEVTVACLYFPEVEVIDVCDSLLGVIRGVEREDLTSEEFLRIIAGHPQQIIEAARYYARGRWVEAK